MYSRKQSIIFMIKSSHFNKSISYVISKYSPSHESFNQAVLLYVSFYINTVKYIELKVFSLAYYSEEI